MTKCLACLKNSETFIKLDELRNQRYLEFSTKFYGGLLNTLGKSLEPELMKCKSCNHVFYKNMPSDELLTAMYSYKSPRKNDPSRPPNYNMVKTMHKCFKLIGKTNPIMLDYGAGFGRWSVAGVKAGFKVIAYDPHAERTVKNPDYELFINKKDMPDIEYDFIWCEQVLEHAKDPYAVLKDIKKFANLETIIKISVPNIDRAKEGKDIWDLWPYDGKDGNHTMVPYQHLQGFCQKSLNSLVYRAGLKKFSSFKLVANYPFEKIRFLIGKLFVRLSTTSGFFKIK